MCSQSCNVNNDQCGRDVTQQSDLCTFCAQDCITNCLTLFRVNMNQKFKLEFFLKQILKIFRLDDFTFVKF